MKTIFLSYLLILSFQLLGSDYLKYHSTKNNEIILLEFNNNIITEFNDVKFLNFDSKIQIGEYLFQENDKIFFKIRISNLLFYFYKNKMISFNILKSLTILKKLIILTLQDLYRIIQGKITSQKVLNIVKNKIKNKNLLILLNERLDRHKNTYWEIKIILIKKLLEDYSYSGFIHLEINSTTGKIIAEY